MLYKIAGRGPLVIAAHKFRTGCCRALFLRDSPNGFMYWLVDAQRLQLGALAGLEQMLSASCPLKSGTKLDPSHSCCVLPVLQSGSFWNCGTGAAVR
jgi:hypothetical protein